MNKKTKEEKEMKRPGAEVVERFGVRPQMAHGEMEAANCDLQIAGRIVQIRGIPVMLDRDLAELYGVDVKRLNEQVKRNVERFPPDFMFQLTKDECLRSQIATLNMERGKHLKYYPYVFTEGGVAMLSGVLRSPTAIEVNIRIMRAFVAMRHVLMSSAGILQRLGNVEVKLIETDKRLDTVFDALDRSKLLPCGILPANSEYDSIRMVSRLIAQAKSELLIIDPYADVTLLDILSEKASGVTVRLICKDRGKPTRSEIEKFNRQYKGLTVEHSDDFHDRYILIDNAELHNLGSSINYLGCRVTNYSTSDPKEIKKLHALLGD